MDSQERSSPKPGGVILAQKPGPGVQLEQGSTVHLVVSSTSAEVPDVVNEDYDTAVGYDLAQAGLVNITVVDDFRTDVTPGTVTRTSPVAFSNMRKAAVLQVFVARDPHVDVPNLQGTDQAAAIQRLKDMGLEVAIKTATSRTYASGLVIKNDHVGDTLVRGDTVTITVSTGPKMVKVPIVTTWSSRRRPRRTGACRLRGGDRDHAGHVVVAGRRGAQREPGRRHRGRGLHRHADRGCQDQEVAVDGATRESFARLISNAKLLGMSSTTAALASRSAPGRCPPAPAGAPRGQRGR